MAEQWEKQEHLRIKQLGTSLLDMLWHGLGATQFRIELAASHFSQINHQDGWLLLKTFHQCLAYSCVWFLTCVLGIFKVFFILRISYMHMKMTTCTLVSHL